MSNPPDPAPLCRYEELARRENRLRQAEASARVAAANQLASADNLKGGGVDIPDPSPVERASRRAPG